MAEQIDLSDPLSNPQVAALYFNRSNLPADDPGVVGAKKSVQEYFERLAAPEPTMVATGVVEDPESTVGIDNPATREEMGLPPLVEPYDLAGDLARDGYQSVLEPSYVAEMTPKLYEMLDTYGGRDSVHVQQMAAAMGESEAAKAWGELEKIATEHPTWNSNKKLRAKVISLNHTVDAATLRIFAKLS